MPKQEAIVIIQQTGAKTYHLEGGEGICIIDKIEKSVLEEDVTPDEETQKKDLVTKKVVLAEDSTNKKHTTTAK